MADLIPFPLITEVRGMNAYAPQGLVGDYDYYPYASPSKTGAQNRDLIQAAIDAAPVGTNIHLPAGVLELDKAASADPGVLTGDYCLRLKTGVRLVGSGRSKTTLKLADDQLTVSPSLRQLAIISTSTNGTGSQMTDWGVVGIGFDGNPQNQNGYSTYDQLGATMGIRCTPGSTEAESVANVVLEDVLFKDFFGNPINIGSGSGYFIDGFYGRRIIAYRCGEGPQLIRVKNFRLDTIRYVDDNPTALQGVGTGYVTVGDPIECAYCEDGVLVGLSVTAGTPTDLNSPYSGGGSGVDLFNSKRLYVFGVDVYWSNGIELGFTPGGCEDIFLSSVQLRNPTPASVSTSTIGIDCCPRLKLSDVSVEGYGVPVRLKVGPWSAGTGCIVDYSNLTIKGGGENSGSYVQVDSGCVFRGSNLQITPNEYRLGSLTTRTSTTEGTVTLTKSPSGFIATNDTVRIVWCDTGGVRRYRTSTVSVSGSVLTLSGGSGTDLPAAATSLWVDKPLNAADLQAGIRIAYSASGVSADTRVEVTGGRIISPGQAVFVDGAGSSFTPGGFIKNIDATSSNGGAWPFTNQNNGLFNGIEVSNVQPKQALTNGLYYAGAELLIAGATQTALANGSKNQRVRLMAAPVADPYTPNGTYNFGNTSAATASRINLYPYLVVQPFENGAGVELLRDDSGVYNEVSRWYPVHQNRPGQILFTAPVTVGTTYLMDPGLVRMPAVGRVTSMRLRPVKSGAAWSAGTIAASWLINGTPQGLVLDINTSNTTGETFSYSARVGNAFTASTTYGWSVAVSGDFAWTGGPSDICIEFNYET